MTKARKTPAVPDAARLEGLQAKLKSEGRLGPEEAAELMDGEFRRQRRDHDERLALRRRGRTGRRPPSTQRAVLPQAPLDVTYAVLRADRERLLAELEFLRQRVAAAEQAQAEMRRLMLAVTESRLPERERPPESQPAVRFRGEGSASQPGFWGRLRGLGGGDD